MFVLHKGEMFYDDFSTRRKLGRSLALPKDLTGIGNAKMLGTVASHL